MHRALVLAIAVALLAAAPATPAPALAARVLPVVPAAPIPPVAPAFTERAHSAAPAGATASDPQWRWPVDPPRSIARNYLAPATPYSSGHRGVDIRAPGSVVYAPAAGVVHFAGVVVDRPVLSIQHAGGLLSSYEPVQSSLSAGQVVHRGDVIGTVLPGHCSGQCLHFGVRLHGEYVNPLRFLGGVPWAVLLPTR
jgi:murein DD-endopeptidase MepM/ murein hydrolase activator NlpD